MSIDQGRTGRLWLKKEAAYGVSEPLVAANAMRYISLARTHQPHNRVNSPEKNATPGQSRRFDRKPTSVISGLVFNIQPSGALNTLSENDPLFELAFGSKTNVTLSTTLSGTPTTTGGTVASAGALAVGDGVLISVTGTPPALPNGQAAPLGPYVRKITAVAGNVLTWAPALPLAPTSGDAVKGTVTYKLTTLLSLSMTILRGNPTGKKEEFLGVGMDSLGFVFDANAEVQVTASGPGRTVNTTAEAQAMPASTTFTGDQNPPSGIADGYTLIDGVFYYMKSMTIDFTNALNPRNTEYGVRLPIEINRNGIREVNISLDAWCETEATLKDKAEDGLYVSLLNQSGRTQGNIIAVFLPKVDFGYPDQDDPDGEVNWTFPGVALESVQGANDELTLILA